MRAKLPPEEPEEGVILFVPLPFINQLRAECSKLGIEAEELVRNIVEDYLFGQRFEEINGTFLALMSFASSVPFEITVKAVKDGEIFYLWANDLFLRMAGGLELKNIYHRTAKEVWASDPERAKELERLDREVLRTGQPLVHFDLVHVGKEVARPRVGIRFPIGDHRASIAFLGSLGMDFPDAEKAQAFCKAILPGGGDWSPLLVPRKKKKPR